MELHVIHILRKDCGNLNNDSNMMMTRKSPREWYHLTKNILSNKQHKNRQQIMYITTMPVQIPVLNRFHIRYKVKVMLPKIPLKVLL